LVDFCDSAKVIIGSDEDVHIEVDDGTEAIEGRGGDGTNKAMPIQSE
jgi:hypothetical protein